MDVDPDRSHSRALSARGILLLLLVPVLLSAALWFWLHQRYDDAQERADADRAALEAARSAMLVWGAVDHRDVDAYVERVKESATGDFLEQFGESEPALRELLEDNRSVQVPTLPEDGVGLVERIDDTARALVVMDTTVVNREIRRADMGPQPRSYRLLVTLTEDAGTWRVSGLEVIDVRA